MRSRRSVTVKDPFHASPTPVSEFAMTPFAETLRHIDDLMAEARLLRERLRRLFAGNKSRSFPRDDTGTSHTSPTGVDCDNNDPVSEPQLAASPSFYFLLLAATHAFACWPTMSTRFPIARLTSIRCNPQLATTWPAAATSPAISSVRGSDASLCTVTSRYVACSFDLHSAVSKPGTLTHAVSIDRPGTTHGFGVVFPTIIAASVERYA